MASIGSGVIVPDHAVAAAAALLGEQDTSTIALVGLHTASTASAAIEALRADTQQSAADYPAWQRLHPGLTSADAAAARATVAADAAARREAADHRIRAARDIDRRLTTTVHDFLHDYPEGHLAGLVDQLTALHGLIRRLDAYPLELDQELEELEVADAADSDLASTLQKRRQTVAAARQIVEGLAIRAGTLKATRAANEEAATAAGHARTAAEELADQRAEANRAAADERNEATRARELAIRYRADMALVTLLDPDHPINPATPDVPLDALRAAFEDARRAYEQQASDSVLAERERALTERLGELDRQFARIPTATLHLARHLLGTAAGADPGRRAEALRAAETAADTAQQAAGDAQATLRARTAERNAITVGRGSVPREPVDLDEATRLREEEEARGLQASNTETTATNRKTELEAVLAGQQERVRVFNVLTDDLGDPAADQPAYPGSAADARVDRKEVLAARTAATEAATAAAQTLTEAIMAARQVASRFADVPATARDRLSNEPAQLLAGRAAELSENLRRRIVMLDAQLDEIAADQQIVTSALAHLVSDALRTLKAAERHSTLPATLGGKKLLHISFTEPTTADDLLAHMDRVVDRRVTNGLRTEGMSLLKAAVHEAAGPRGFNVKVLKPTGGATTISEDVSRIGIWSGGEKLTTCIALYCSLAALRAVNAGRRDRSGGVLMLDNPVGRASHGTLIRLQRDVAAAHGVQLVYTTGVKDIDALAPFPNVVRLANRAGRATGRRYVVPDDAAHLGVFGVRVAHDAAVEKVAPA